MHPDACSFSPASHVDAPSGITSDLANQHNVCFMSPSESNITTAAFGRCCAAAAATGDTDPTDALDVRSLFARDDDGSGHFFDDHAPSHTDADVDDECLVLRGLCRSGDDDRDNAAVVDEINACLRAEMDDAGHVDGGVPGVACLKRRYIDCPWLEDSDKDTDSGKDQNSGAPPAGRGGVAWLVGSVGILVWIFAAGL